MTFIVGGIDHLGEDTKERLVGIAKNYNYEELELFKAELGWEDWMNDFCDCAEAEEPTPNELKNIDITLKEVFDLAHPIVKKFELKKSTVEISFANRARIKEGCTYGQEAELIKPFDNEEDALEALEKYQTEIRELRGTAGTYYVVTEYYVEENTYTNDEWITGGDVWRFSEMKISLVEKSGYETVKTFDNMADAERAYNEYDGENGVCLQF